MKEIILKVQGMMCDGCENRIQNMLINLEGVQKVVANHKDSTVQIITKEEINIETIKEKIEDIGFEVKE